MLSQNLTELEEDVSELQTKTYSLTTRVQVSPTPNSFANRFIPTGDCYIMAQGTAGEGLQIMDKDDITADVTAIGITFPANNGWVAMFLRKGTAVYGDGLSRMFVRYVE